MSVSGAFLIPYSLMLIFEGIPLFVIELSIGQRLRKGPLHVWWEINPYLAGIGIASCIVSFLCAVYYNTVVSWCVLYFFRSFTYPSPWSECPPSSAECQVNGFSDRCSRWLRFIYKEFTPSGEGIAPGNTI